jgi:hypothetical protein
MATAANRKSDAVRLPDRLFRDDKTLPPDILLLGARQSQEVKCFALGLPKDHRRIRTQA